MNNIIQSFNVSGSLFPNRSTIFRLIREIRYFFSGFFFSNVDMSSYSGMVEHNNPRSYSSFLLLNPPKIPACFAHEVFAGVWYQYDGGKS